MPNSGGSPDDGRDLGVPFVWCPSELSWESEDLVVVPRNWERDQVNG